MPPLRAIIVDDEAPARARLRQLLAEVAPPDDAEGVTLLGEAASGPEALALVARTRAAGTPPDLVFLDVQMPEMDGLTLLRRLEADPDAAPVAVLTTAFDKYAVAAFELGALDYLRKPFGATRLAAALARVRLMRRARDGRPSRDASSSDGAPTAASAGLASTESAEPASAAERLRWAAAATAPEAGPLTRLFVRDRGRIVVVRVADVERLEGEDDYVAVHVAPAAGGRRHLVYLTLQEFERRLDPTQFLRVHRSHIVNLEHVVALAPHDATRLQLELRSGARIVASRTCSRELRTLVI